MIPLSTMRRAWRICYLLFAICYYASAQTPCPPQGDSKRADLQSADILKNRTEIPASSAPMAIENFFKPGDDTHRFSETTAVMTTGYVRAVKWGGLETCECHVKDQAVYDIHIELVPSPDYKGLPMIVEMNRYGRALHGPSSGGQVAWNVKDIRAAYLRKMVTVAGWLFWDGEHKQNATNTAPANAKDWRATAWEIHPVTNIKLVDGK